MTDAISRFSLNHPWLTTYIALRVVAGTCKTAQKFLSLFQRAPTAVAVVQAKHEFTIEGDQDKGKKAVQVFLDKAWQQADDSTVKFSWKVVAK